MGYRRQGREGPRLEEVHKVVCQRPEEDEGQQLGRRQAAAQRHGRPADARVGGQQRRRSQSARSRAARQAPPASQPASQPGPCNQPASQPASAPLSAGLPPRGSPRPKVAPRLHGGLEQQQAAQQGLAEEVDQEAPVPRDARHPRHAPRHQRHEYPAAGQGGAGGREDAAPPTREQPAHICEQRPRGYSDGPCGRPFGAGSGALETQDLVVILHRLRVVQFRHGRRRRRRPTRLLLHAGLASFRVLLLASGGLLLLSTSARANV